MTEIKGQFIFFYPQIYKIQPEAHRTMVKSCKFSILPVIDCSSEKMQKKQQERQTKAKQGGKN